MKSFWIGGGTGKTHKKRWPCEVMVVWDLLISSTRQGMPEALLEDGRCKEGFFFLELEGLLILILDSFAFRES